MIRVFPAATRMLRLRILFCFAPISSSPSSKNTGKAPGVDELQLGDTSTLADLCDNRALPLKRLIKREIPGILQIAAETAGTRSNCDKLRVPRSGCRLLHQ